MALGVVREVDPAEHASDEFFIVDVAVGHVDHGGVDAGQPVDEDLGGVLDLLDVGAVRLMEGFTLVVVAPGRPGRRQSGLQLGECVRESNALVVELRRRPFDVSDLDVEYLACIADDFASAPSDGCSTVRSQPGNDLRDCEPYKGAAKNPSVW
ncbi:hypothetical protein ACWCQW_42440 [Streptomyces mirabilis]